VKPTCDPYEQTTAATDALIAAVALTYTRQFAALRTVEAERATLWSGAFGAMAAAAGLGAVAHGLELTPLQRRYAWRPINFCLGIALACFAAGAVRDTWGSPAARRTFGALALGALGFTVLAERLDKGFVAFVAYEAAVLIFALGAYSRLACLGALPGAGRISSGILLTMLAAAVQTQRRHVRLLGIPLDHNGLFHLVQLAALPPLASGVRAGFAETD
jgi:hypothetical protein